VIRDKNGKPTHCVGLFQDITERKTAEESLLLFKNLLNHTDDAIFANDPATGRFLIANDKACVNLGYDRDTLLTMRTLDIEALFPDYASWESHVSEVKSRGHLTVDGMHKRKDGTLYPVEVSIAYLSLSGRDYMVAVARDVTERQKAIEALKAAVYGANEEKAKSEAIISAIGDEMIILDPAFKILYQNKVAVDRIGDHAGRICYQVFENRDAICEGCPVALSFMDGQVHRGERIAETILGVLHLDIMASPLLDSSGNVVAVIEMVKDVTERRQAEDELRRHREQLIVLVDERTEELIKTNEKLMREISQRERMEAELIKSQKLQSLGILAGGIAHDFNNLLTTTIGNISLALLDLDSKHPAYRQLAAADRAMQRAQNLTQQLLTFSKGGAPVKKTLRLGDLIEEVAGFALRGSRARYELALPDDLWFIDADSGQLSQVFHNLVLNADQAMPNGGVIAFTCENTVLSGGDASLLPPGRYVKVTVQDSGIGISREHLPNIFDPYFTTKQRGSGLGLATSYSIVSKHGGHISVVSEPGRRTAFTLMLPASSNASVPATHKEDSLKRGAGKILLMDDEEEVLRTTGDALARLGYSISYADDGSKAIELYREAIQAGEPFVAVILDLTVRGGMGGKETIEQLLKIDPDVKAIVSSGYSNDPIMADHRAHGFAGVVSKPYRLKQMSNIVYRVIKGENIEGPLNGDEETPNKSL
jgi:PAS domain S-box-containing protein